MTSRGFDQSSMRPLRRQLQRQLQQQQRQQHTLRCLARQVLRRNIPTLALLTPHAPPPPPRAPPIPQLPRVRGHPYTTTTATPHTMSDPTATATTAEEDAYTKFLLKQSTTDYSTPKTSKATSTSTSTSALPPPPRETLPASVTALVDSGRYYTSDVDEEFKAVSLPAPSAAVGTVQSSSTQVSSRELALALGVAEGAVSKLSVQEWDPRQEYRDVVGAVSDWLRQGSTAAAAAAATGDGAGAVAIFAVQGQGARVEYFVVGLLRGGEPDGHRIVGTRVLAVES